MSEEKPVKAKTSHELADEMPASLPYALREAMATLKLEGDDLPRVIEGVFVRDILPVLTGEEGDRVDMKWWGGRFDSPFKGFYIVNDQNEVLFEVPPMLSRNFKLNPPENPRDTINEDRARHAQRAYNRPKQAREEYDAALRKRLDLSGARRPLEHMKMLDKIFIHYGKPSIFEQAADEDVRNQSAVPGGAKDSGHGPVEQPAKVFEEANYSDDGLLD